MEQQTADLVLNRQKKLPIVAFDRGEEEEKNPCFSINYTRKKLGDETPFLYGYFAFKNEE